MYYARRSQPVGNKVLHEAEVRRRQDIHKARLAAMKPSIDTKAPPDHRHMHKNAKREAMLEDRYAKIEHENRLLLTKMSDIMTRAHSMDTVNTSWQYGHSLNRARRAREIARITEDNLKILQRIQSVTPIYSHVRWEEERIAQEKLLENIQEYKPSIRGGAGSPRVGDDPHAGYSYGDEGGAPAPSRSAYPDLPTSHSIGAGPVYPPYSYSGMGTTTSTSYAGAGIDTYTTDLSSQGPRGPSSRSILASSGASALGPTPVPIEPAAAPRSTSLRTASGSGLAAVHALSQGLPSL